MRQAKHTHLYYLSTTLDMRSATSLTLNSFSCSCYECRLAESAPSTCTPWSASAIDLSISAAHGKSALLPSPSNLIAIGTLRLEVASSSCSGPVLALAPAPAGGCKGRARLRHHVCVCARVCVCVCACFVTDAHDHACVCVCVRVCL